MEKIPENYRRKIVTRLNKIKAEIGNTKNDLETEAFDIYLQRVNNGSSKRRALIDTISDIKIKYQKPINGDRIGSAKRIKRKAKQDYYESWCHIIAIITLTQITSTFGMLYSKIPTTELIIVESLFGLLAILMFILVLITIRKDKNYNTNNELEFYYECQCQAFTVLLLTPLFILFDALRRLIPKK